MDITSITIQPIGGALGGNVAGNVMKQASLGSVGNSIVGILGGVVLMAMCLAGALTQTLRAQDSAPAVLFEDVRIFDGVSERLSAPSNVLTVGDVVTTIAATPIAVPSGTPVTRIAGRGRTLMPGLIDAHTHIMFATLSQEVMLTADVPFVTVVAVKGARDMLMRSFTGIRDVGGPSLGLKPAIDMGAADGPRIWSSGAMISQTGGHGGFRLPNELPAAPGSFSVAERIGASAIADSPEAVRQRAREQLALGATHLKLMAGGGVGSSFDPLDVTQFTVPEIGAAVADLLLVNGDPVANFALVEDPASNFVVIMKGGRIYKNLVR